MALTDCVRRGRLWGLLPPLFFAVALVASIGAVAVKYLVENRRTRAEHEREVGLLLRFAEEANAAAGRTVLNWNRGIPFRQWDGVRWWDGYVDVSFGRLTPLGRAIARPEWPLVTHLDLPKRGLAGTLALEGLHHLQHLDLADNALTDLRVADAPRLSWLNVEGNRLSTLTLEAVDRLEDVVAGRNALTSWDPPALPGLRTLVLRDNALAAVGLGGSPRLYSLVLDENPLDILDASANPRLMIIEAQSVPLTRLAPSVPGDPADPLAVGLAFLSLHGAKMTKLDLSACRSLSGLEVTDSPVERLLLPSGAPLDRLMLSGLPVTTLELPGRGAALVRLYLAETALAELDLSAATKLRELNLYDSPKLTRLALPPQGALEKVQLRNLGVEALDWAGHDQLADVYLDDLPLTRLAFGAARALWQVSVTGTELAALDLSSAARLEYANLVRNRFATVALPAEAPLRMVSLGNNRLPLSVLARLPAGARNARLPKSKFGRQQNVAFPGFGGREDALRVGEAYDLSAEFAVDGTASTAAVHVSGDGGGFYRLRDGRFVDAVGRESGEVELKDGRIVFRRPGRYRLDIETAALEPGRSVVAESKELVVGD